MTTPTPEQIRAARARSGLTQTEAGAVLGVTCRAWQRWEADTGLASHRAMTPAMFELFRIKTGAKTSPRAD